MDSRAVITIEIEKDGHKYNFSMPIGSPLGTAYNVAHELLMHITDMAKQAADQAGKPRQEAEEGVLES